MEILNSYNLIIASSLILILSFFFGEVSKRTNIPSVLMLIILGIGIKIGMDALKIEAINFFPILEVLGIVGLIMIVLEAALELKLKPEKYIPIAKAFGIALVGLLLSIWVAALILYQFIPDMTMESAWLYATPISILSSAIIIPSVTAFREDKKEFHIYESTFSDILGIMVFYFFAGQIDAAEHSSGLGGFFTNILLTIIISLLVSYVIVFIFQNIRSHVKLFLLIAVLLLLYALGKKMHLSSLIIILVFGLLIANMKLFFRGRFKPMLNFKHAQEIYEGLHVITMESAFVVRTYFFVVFGITITLASLISLNVALVSLLVILSIYIIRFVILRLLLGKDILPQLFIAPRGLITVLLFYAIPQEAQIAGFDAGILLFIIIGTSIIMTLAMVRDKRQTEQAVRKALINPVGYEKWKAPSIDDVQKKDK